ncbi:MAG: undecaprenyldiphospho-muramoylpentapeptide beta-N-acetylglucosaminyltransferase [Peptococcales bacterium]|jgi:UDP-N-acetylglucosamine--N-acetylmuramyl-(pentapeptide) pyrophosphoryl-undecaprenol N-acetylglucosamine transferase
MRILFTGGGTGGHVYPALALAKKIIDNGGEVLYVGTSKGLEAKIVPEAGIPFDTIEVEGWQRKFSLQALRTGIKAFKGVAQAFNIARKFKPQLIVGTGGYVCGPVVFAGSILQIPTIIHEQNALPGITNKILARIVNKIMITFPSSEKYFPDSQKIVLTGLPVREVIFQVDKKEAIEFFGLDPKKLTLLVSGGSRGAKSINTTFAGIYPKLLKLPNLQIIHITGEDGYDYMLKELANHGIELGKFGNLILRPYLYEMEYGLKAADFCVGRAGATFIAEITAIGLPAILIPYPYAAENHQEYNARTLVENGGAVMILDKNLNGDVLLDVIDDLINDSVRLQDMSKNMKKAGNPDSLAKIMKVIEQEIKNA